MKENLVETYLGEYSDFTLNSPYALSENKDIFLKKDMLIEELLLENAKNYEDKRYYFSQFTNLRYYDDLYNKLFDRGLMDFEVEEWLYCQEKIYDKYFATDIEDEGIFWWRLYDIYATVHHWSGTGRFAFDGESLEELILKMADRHRPRHKPKRFSDDELISLYEKEGGPASLMDMFKNFMNAANKYR